MCFFNVIPTRLEHRTFALALPSSLQCSCCSLFVYMSIYVVYVQSSPLSCHWLVPYCIIVTFTCLSLLSDQSVSLRPFVLFARRKLYALCRLCQSIPSLMFFVCILILNLFTPWFLPLVLPLLLCISPVLTLTQLHV